MACAILGRLILLLWRDFTDAELLATGKAYIAGETISAGQAVYHDGGTHCYAWPPRETEA